MDQRSGVRELIDLRREDEVVAGKPRGGLRPRGEGCASPLELEARMMAFRLGQQRDPYDESEGANEVVERELTGQVTGSVEIPGRHCGTKPGDLGLWERWRSRRVFPAVILEKLVEYLGDGRTVPRDRFGAVARSLKPEAAWNAVELGFAEILDLRTKIERRRYGAPPGARPVSLVKHVASPEGPGSIYLCQRALRSKATLRRGASEVEGGFAAWRDAGLPVDEVD
jgi:rhodanese-related sulfurtransferase